MGKIISSMTGIVSNVFVEVGEEIETGQEVLTIESMKMQIPVESEASGVISKINVNIGDFINEGDVLVTLE